MAAAATSYSHPQVEGKGKEQNQGQALGEAVTGQGLEETASTTDTKCDAIEPPSGTITSAARPVFSTGGASETASCAAS